MRRRATFRYPATARYHVVELTTRPGYLVLDTATGRTVGRSHPFLRHAILAALALTDDARPPPSPPPPTP